MWGSRMGERHTFEIGHGIPHLYRLIITGVGKMPPIWRPSLTDTFYKMHEREREK